LANYDRNDQDDCGVVRCSPGDPLTFAASMPVVKLANKARLVIGSTVVQIVMKSRMIFSIIE